MPFESKSQQRFMFAKHPEMAKEWADKTPNISALPEHVKKMADGGVSDADERSSDYPNAKMTGMPPEVLSTLMGGLMGGMNPVSAAKEIGPALEGLGETGSMTIGRAAPKMEEAAEAAAPKVEAFIKGVQKSPNGNEVKIWGVKGDPDEISKLGYGSDPASVPEHILRAKGILPETTNVPSQSAPNAYANGGYTEGGKVERSSLEHKEPNAMMARAMAGGGYPHVTFLENETPDQAKKDTHMEGREAIPMNMTETGEKNNPSHMAVGGAVLKTENREKKPTNNEISHEEKLKTIYKAMGIKKYADGGSVIPSDGTINVADLPGGGMGAPNPNDPGFWDQIKIALSKMAAPGMMPGVAEKAADIAATPGIAPAINAALNTNLPGPAAAPALPSIPPEAAPAALPPAATPKLPIPTPTAALPGAPSANPVPKDLFNEDTSKLTTGVNAEDRQALVNKMQTQQHGIGSVITEVMAGLGDALAAKGGREQHSLQNIFSMQKDQRAEALANFDKARQDRLEKLDLQTKMGSNAIQKLAAKDAYGTDEHLNKILGAPLGTAHKDLPLYFQMKTAQVAQQEKDADLYMKAHTQAAADVDNAVKNASVLGFKPSAEQIQARGEQLAARYNSQAKGLYHTATNPQTGHKIESYDGGMSWRDAGAH